MAITPIASATPTGNPTTSFTITIPTVLVGDLLIVDVFHGGTGTPTVTDDDTGGETWTKKNEFDGTACSLSTWYKRATSATSAKTISVGSLTDSGCGGLEVYRGVVTSGDPFDGTPVGESNASGNETQAEITTLTDGAMVVLVVGVDVNNAIDSQTCTSPGTLTELWQKLTTGGANSGIAHASAVKATAGATGAFTWAHTDVLGVSVAYALRPSIVLTVNDTDTATELVTVTIGSTTGIKTVDAVDKASVKTINSLIIASVKTWGGLA